jgi:hypothetical protein
MKLKKLAFYALIALGVIFVWNHFLASRAASAL